MKNMDDHPSNQIENKNNKAILNDDIKNEKKETEEWLEDLYEDREEIEQESNKSKNTNKYEIKNEKEKKDNLEQTPKKIDINAFMKEMNDKNTKKEIKKANPGRLTINYDMFKNSNKLKEEKPANVPKKLDINKFLKDINEEKKK